ncbi:MAG TPA: AraC family transcriptional regulator [Microscillaceae bacterium]|nr:AraC family transcriptional regulator [Microscillaceae bacterium]
MKKISILALDGCPVTSIVGPMDAFCLAGKVWQNLNKGSKHPFEIEIVSGGSNPVIGFNNYPIYCHKTIYEVTDTNLILVPSLQLGNLDLTLEKNYQVIEWIKKQFKKGAEIGSFCTGTFLLAEAGLLNHKSATIHRKVAQLFQKCYPKVHLKLDRGITDEGNIFCSSEATSFLNLTVYLIEKYCGVDVAACIGQSSFIGVNKLNQNNFAIFSLQKKHQDAPVLSMQNFIENHYQEKITLDCLTERFHLSKRNLIRRFKMATGNTPNQYIQRVRIEAVKKGLENNSGNITDMMYSVGYTDENYFRKLFKKYTGQSPSDYKNKFKSYSLDYIRT